MELIRGLQNLEPRHRGCVATIGNFDGVHLGHQSVIRQLQRQQAVLGVPSTVIVFEPQPLEYFAVPNLPPRLTTFREKYDLLAGYGVDRVLCVRFGRSLAELTADAFVRTVLVDGLGVKYLVVGDDFRFGRGRTGDFAALQAAGEGYGFRVDRTETLELDGERVSSTHVRAALQVGDLDAAARLLGRPYEIFGKVAHGDKRGRDWGFPTANIHLNRRKSPLTGVFAVTMRGIDHAPLTGVANLGNRPTVGGTRTLLEVHLFDFDREIYRHWVAVRFLYKLRDEQQFESVDALKAQIERDIHRARGYFRSHMAKCS